MATSRRLRHRQLTSNWSPKSLSRLMGLWLADAVTVPDGGAVSSWPDWSTYGNSLGQGTGGAQPTYRLSSIGGQPAVDFDGTDDFVYTTALVSSYSHGSVFSVLSVDSLTNAAVWSSIKEADLDEYIVGGTRTTGAVNTMNIEQSDPFASNVRAPTDALTASVNYLLEWCSTGTAWELRINGVSQSLTVIAGSNNGDWFADSLDRNNFAVGAQKFATPNGFLNGRVALVAVVDGAVDPGDRLLLNRWVTAKYGITIA